MLYLWINLLIGLYSTIIILWGCIYGIKEIKIVKTFRLFTIFAKSLSVLSNNAE